VKKTYSKLIRNSCGLNNFLTKLGPSADLGKSARQKGITIKLSVNCGPRQGQNAMEKGGDWRRERGLGLGLWVTSNGTQLQLQMDHISFSPTVAVAMLLLLMLLLLLLPCRYCC